jgi:hypothetical protein
VSFHKGELIVLEDGVLRFSSHRDTGTAPPSTSALADVVEKHR